MTLEEREAITSNDYADLIIDYRGNPGLLQAYPNAVVHTMNTVFAVLYIPSNQLTAQSIGIYGYNAIPKLFGLASEASIEASRIDDLRELPAFNLRGDGVLIGIVDTGIDYLNPVFRNVDGTTKIRAIWDQTIQSVDRYPLNTMFGTEYTQEDINLALASENPLEVVPTFDDTGHGTMMAAVAAGTDIEVDDFYGVAPNSELLIVKLQQAKPVMRRFFAIQEGAVCYQENNIMWGVQYLVERARSLGMPIAICIGIGTSMTAHDGRSYLSIQTNVFADITGVGIVAAAGNEGNLGRHFYGVVDPAIGYNTVELNVGEGDSSFVMELWGDSPGIFSIDILSPSGEHITRIAANIYLHREISFIFEQTIIFVDFILIEASSGDQLIMLRFQNATPGVWRFNVYGGGDLAAGFHIWLPMGDFISNQTYFIQSNIYTTLVAPGTAEIPITVTAYNPQNGNLFLNASRGFTRLNIIKPELAAPGVNYIAPTLNNEYIGFTGTGVAAAHTTGVVALILEWGIIRGNYPRISSPNIKNFLIRGARRRPNLTYPNRDWGYGVLDVFNVFDVLRADITGR